MGPRQAVVEVTVLIPRWCFDVSDDDDDDYDDDDLVPGCLDNRSISQNNFIFFHGFLIQPNLVEAMKVLQFFTFLQIIFICKINQNIQNSWSPCDCRWSSPPQKQVRPGWHLLKKSFYSIPHQAPCLPHLINANENLQFQGWRPRWIHEAPSNEWSLQPAPNNDNNEP